MFNHNAIESVGRDSLLIQNNKVIGKVKVVTMVGMICGAMMKDDACKELVKETAQIKIWSESKNEIMAKDPCRFAYFHFNSISGEYIGDYVEQNKYREKQKALEDCFIVDKFNFEYGWCPSTFSTVEGFGSRLKA